MSQQQPEGTYVKVRVTYLEAGERIGRIPADTEQTPLLSFQQGWVKGEATIGVSATILTETGRTVTGTVVEVGPRYTHSFGYRLPAISAVRAQIQAWKAQQ